jgi:dihydroorotate dehydrogenase electron transfer subunit
MILSDTTIVRIDRLNEAYAYIQFRAEHTLGGAPGQFIMVRGSFESDPILPRAFSLVGAGETGSILVKAVGKATRQLTAMRTGDRLTVFGPLGNRFSIPAPDITPLLVAGGVGVAPLIFMAEQLFQSGRRPIFLYGGRTHRDLVLQDRIAGVADLMVATEDGSQGERGRVTDLLAPILERHNHLAVFSCGPEPMMRALHSTLPGGLRLEVALEQAMACGMGTCKGCAVRDRKGEYRYVCSDGPVFNADDVFGGVG